MALWNESAEREPAAALLPAFGGHGMYGRRVHQAVLESGTATTGATVHHVEADYDTGPIIAQAEVAVLHSDTVDTLSTRVQDVERALLVTTLATIAGCDAEHSAN